MDVPIWETTAPSGPQFQSLDQDITTDIAVVGGGFTGLSAVLDLAKNKANVALFETDEIGSGASGRNNGQVIPTLKKEDPKALLKRYGPVHGPRVITSVRDSANLVFSLIKQHDIDCEVNQGGWIQPALTSNQLETVKRRAESWEQQDANVELLDRQQTADALGSDFYIGSWRANEGGSIQPLAYARGLAQAALDHGARIFSRSAVTLIERTSDSWKLGVGKHIVKSQRIILATAVNTHILAPELAGQIIPATFYQLATRPLSPDINEKVLPDCASMSDLQGDIYFFRKDAAGRLVTGGTFIFSRNWQRRIVNLVKRRLDHVFPHIEHFETEAQWSGQVAMTIDAFPRISELGPGFFGWVGCNSRGIALSTLIGIQLAKLVTDAPPQDQPFPLESFLKVPLRSFAGVGIAAVLIGARTKDSIGRLRTKWVKYNK